MYTFEKFFYVRTDIDRIEENNEFYYLFSSVIVVTHSFLSDYLRKIRLCPFSSFSIAKVIIINCKRRRRNQALCLIIAFDLRHIYVQISCAKTAYPTNHRFIFDYVM